MQIRPHHPEDLEQLHHAAAGSCNCGCTRIAIRDSMRLAPNGSRAAPRHRKNDPAAMQQWVEQAPLLSRPRPSSIPASPSRSGSKTKPGSDSKEP